MAHARRWPSRDTLNGGDLAVAADHDLAARRRRARNGRPRRARGATPALSKPLPVGLPDRRLRRERIARIRQRDVAELVVEAARDRARVAARRPAPPAARCARRRSSRARGPDRPPAGRRAKRRACSPGRGGASAAARGRRALGTTHTSLSSAQIAVALAVGREGQQLAVGRPGRLGVVPIAVGDLARLAAPSTSSDEQVLAQASRKPSPSALWRTRVMILTRGGLPFSSDWPSWLAISSMSTRALKARRSPLGDQTGVPAPRFSEVSWRGSPPCSGSRNSCGAIVVAVRQEGQRAAVGRPARRRVAVLAAGQRARRARPVERRQHQLRAIAGVIVRIDPGDDIGHLRAVRADLRISDEAQPIQIIGHHTAAASAAKSHIVLRVSRRELSRPAGPRYG